MDSVTMALLVPSEDDEALARLSGETVIEGVRVAVVAIGWKCGG